MMLPETVDDDASRQRMIGVRQPFRQVEAVEGRCALGGWLGVRIEDAWETGRDASAFLTETAALQDIGEEGGAVLGDGPRLRRRRRPLCFQGVGLLTQRGPLGAVGR